MPHRAVAIGASAGGVEALKLLFGDLPQDLNVAVFVTLHVSPHMVSRLPEILTRASPWPAGHAQEGEAIKPRHVYVAPPDRHLIVRDGVLHLSRGPRENGHRPAVDPMFRSVARHYGRYAVGVVLSGTLDDGTSGLDAIKMVGGIAIAQDPADATFPDMPRNAITAGTVDHVVAARELGALLESLPLPPARPADFEHGPAAYEFDEAIESGKVKLEATDYTCPDCGGVLHQIGRPGGHLQFRCHTGHRWGSDSLRAAQEEKITESLWAALRALEENKKLVHRIIGDSLARGFEDAVKAYRRKLEDIEHHIQMVHGILTEQSEEWRRREPAEPSE